MGDSGQPPTLGKVLADYAELATRNPSFVDAVLGPAWRKAYRRAGRPRGVISSEEGYRLAGLYLQTLKDEFRKVCSRFPSALLFFAVRFWRPAAINELGLSFGEDALPADAQSETMALRRIATTAALLYGRPSPEEYVTLSGGEVPVEQEKRFARTFVSLMILSREYLNFVWGFRVFTAMGYQMFVNDDGMQYLETDTTDQVLLTFSHDHRRNNSYDLLIRLGEFEERANPIVEPHRGTGRETLGNRLALFTAFYHTESSGFSGYAVRAELLAPVENLFLEFERLDPDFAVAAWGMGFRDFIAMVGGFSQMLKERMTDDRIFEMVPNAKGVTMDWHVYWGGTVPFFAPELEDEGEGTLVDYAENYARAKGFESSELELYNARDRFLELAVSAGKPEVEDVSADPLGISLGDGRYSYLMHKFGATYVADLFHADHWLNRPLDLLNDQMRGAAGELKGQRVEDRVWDYMRNSEKIEPAKELRGARIRVMGSKNLYNDLDCPLKVGDVLVLAEVKGKYMARAPESFARPDLVRRRWEENVKFLRKIDQTAELLALRKEDGTFREAMKDIRYILPVVVRPYPEWIPDLEDKHWLRKPARPDVGVPRILTPPELREFLENPSTDALANLPGGFVVDLRKDT